MKKILMLGNSSLVIFGFRGELIDHLTKEHFEVVAVFPNGPFGEGGSISEKYGCRFIEVSINRRGRNIFQDFNLLEKYISIIKSVRPDVVLAYTVKCDIYGGIACRILKVPFIANITGLGAGLTGGITKMITENLYKFAVRKACCVFFQNESDKEFFIKKNIRFVKSAILPGSGVNLNKFHSLPYPDNKKTVFTYIARVMKAKGIEQFLEAARKLKDESRNVEFHICGYCEEDYKDIIREYEDKGIIFYHGLVENVLDYELVSNCIVLPSFHFEGVSNVLLEAAACARPIITTDRPGCREAVDDGITGFLVKEKNSNDLIEKMKKFISLSNDQKKEMGLAGRRKMEIEFDRKIVVDAYVDEIYQIILNNNERNHIGRRIRHEALSVD